MSVRIPLQFVEGRIILAAVVKCRSLRIRHHIMEFVIDTGSQDSFLSSKDVSKLQVPVESRPVSGEIDFGGSRYKQVELPKFSLTTLAEDKTPICLDISLSAVKTTKTSEKRRQIAETLPSILGTNFLIEQKLQLHVILTENISYLQTE